MAPESILASFSASTGLRAAAGLFFFMLLAIWFIRRFRGRGKIVLLAICLALGLLFYLSALAQLLAFIPLGLLLAFSATRPPASRPDYRPAEALVEGGGLKRGLTAAEAAVILETPLHRVLGVVVLGLLRKGVLTIRAIDPLVLGVAPPFQETGDPNPQERARLRRETAQRRGIVLHPYEDPFIEQVGASAGLPLGEVNFTAAARALLRHTARRARGHNLPETRDYYRKHLGRARHDVEFRGSGPDGPRTRDHFFEWMMLDAEFAGLYEGYQPDWMVGAAEGAMPENLVGWVEGMVRTLAASIPPLGLQVRNPQGELLAIGGTDQISTQFFDAVSREIN